MVWPTLALWLYAIAWGAACSLSEDGSLPKRADLAAQIALALILASWVTADAHKRGRQLYYDYDSLVFFAWPVLVPIYLFQTRGLRAFLTLLCFASLWVLAALSSLVVSLVVGAPNL